MCAYKGQKIYIYMFGWGFFGMCMIYSGGVCIKQFGWKGSTQTHKEIYKAIAK